MKQTRVILVGGFLGAGKTTLIWKAAESLMAQEKKVGLITNDQAPELVDSELLRRQHLEVNEVAGSCFCCNFKGFIDAVRMFSDTTDYVFAEPVGSCTDLSATILQPLKKYWNTLLLTSPLTVLADPERLCSILNGESAGLHEDASYIYRKQLEEADIIVITKADTLSAETILALKSETEKKFPTSQVMFVSSLTGTGLHDWLKEVITRTDAGKRLLDIDYDRYAHGESVLGWLNGTILLHAQHIAKWDEWLETFIKSLCNAFDEASIAVGHVKVIVENGKQYAIANITGSSRTINIRKGAGEGEDARVIINARAECLPGDLDHLVRNRLLQTMNNRYTEEVIAWRYIQPGRPEPTHRFDYVVNELM